MNNKTADIILTALSRGVPPRKSAEKIIVGRTKEVESFESDFNDVVSGGGACRFIVGRYGSGKSFLKFIVRDRALKSGFITMDADLSNERRLSGSRKEGLHTYRELITRMSNKGSRDGGALQPILQEWLFSIRDNVAASLGCEPKNVPLIKINTEIELLTQPMAHLTYYQDFISMIEKYWSYYSSGILLNPAIRWLQGEYETVMDVRRDLDMRQYINNDNWFDFIKLWSEFVNIIGYKGLIVFIDEAVIISRLSSPVARKNNYEKILSMYNCINEGYSKYLAVYFCGTDEFVTDDRRGMFSYDALKSRVVPGRYEVDYSNFMGPIINLRLLTADEIAALLQIIFDIHKQRHNTNLEFTLDMYQTYLNQLNSSLGYGKFLTPREISRDFISLLDRLHNDPSTSFEEQIKGRSVSIDVDPNEKAEFDDPIERKVIVS